MNQKERAITQLEQLKRENKLGAGVGGGLTHDQLNTKNKELENALAVAETRANPCLVYNKAYSTFESIA